MSKGLEELKEIELKWQYGVFTFIPNFEIIKKELKAFEIIKKICVIKFYDEMQSVLIRTPDNVPKTIKIKEEFCLLKEELE